MFQLKHIKVALGFAGANVECETDSSASQAKILLQNDFGIGASDNY
jgi:hypothetical protein